MVNHNWSFDGGVVVQEALLKHLNYLFCSFRSRVVEAHETTKNSLQIRKRKWGWLGHTLRKPTEDITRQALEWNPQGKRGRGRPKNTWRRTVLEEAKGMKKSWTEIKYDAKNRVRWRILVDALCSAAE
jgi:hypothetical protein